MRLIVVMAVLALSGCAGLVMDFTPVSREDGRQGYFLRTVYGLVVDGSKEQARAALAREASRLCPNGYTRLREEQHKRLTRWGAENGQVDLIWEIVCRGPKP